MSRRTALSRGNGAATSYGYSQASRLTSLAHNLEGATTTNDANWAFSYNVAGQVTSRSLVQVYETTTTSLNQSYVPNGLNQYASVGGASFTHDARGNLIRDASRSFCYDLENRLTGVAVAAAVNCASPTGSLTYDPLGRLHSYTTGGATTEFLYDGDRLVGEFAPGQLTTPLRRYAHGPGVDEPLIWYEGSATNAGQNWLIADRQGSIIATTSASGIATTYAYDPYGIPREWAGPRFRYTGQAALPELQLYHYKARVYDPGIGRFLQTDPVGYEENLNLYMYTLDDPINAFDPNGAETIFIGGAGDRGAYKQDFVRALGDAGIGNVRGSPTISMGGSLPGGFLVDASLGVLNNNNDISPRFLDNPGLHRTSTNPSEQFNLVGYSWGAVVAAQQASAATSQRYGGSANAHMEFAGTRIVGIDGNVLNFGISAVLLVCGRLLSPF